MPFFCAAAALHVVGDGAQPKSFDDYCSANVHPKNKAGSFLWVRGERQLIITAPTQQFLRMDSVETRTIACSSGVHQGDPTGPAMVFLELRLRLEYLSEEVHGVTNKRLCIPIFNDENRSTPSATETASGERTTKRVFGALTG